jgi:hypothetical protein
MVSSSPQRRAPRPVILHELVTPPCPHRRHLSRSSLCPKITRTTKLPSLSSGLSSISLPISRFKPGPVHVFNLVVVARKGGRYYLLKQGTRVDSSPTRPRQPTTAPSPNTRSLARMKAPALRWQGLIEPDEDLSFTFKDIATKVDGLR